MRSKVADSHIKVRSAGIQAMNGDPVAFPIMSILQSRQISYHHQAQCLSPELVDWADLILTMTRAQKMILMAMVPDAAEKAFTLKEYVGVTHDPDIDDPIGKGAEGYHRLADDLDQTLDRLQQKLLQNSAHA
jgi:protein-tyrosine phosphatase